LQPLRDGRFAPSIHATALLLVPAVALLSALLQSVLVGPLKWADPALLLMALLWPLMAALGEEIGWRGLLLPRLAARLGLLPAALVIGLIWGVWHLPADFVGLKGYGDWFWLAFLVNGPYVLTAHSIIMAWLWKRTGGSLLAAVLYHFSVTASAILAPTAGAEGPSGLAAAAIGATLLWLIAIALIVSPPPRLRAEAARNDISTLAAAAKSGFTSAPSGTGAGVLAIELARLGESGAA
jgi:membrane protease YdiL (CAAX protease family)